VFDTLNPKGEMYAQEELWPNWSLCGCILDGAWRTGAGCRANAGVRSTCAATSPRFTRLNKPAATSLGPIGGVACGSRRALRSMAPFVLAVFS